MTRVTIMLDDEGKIVSQSFLSNSHASLGITKATPTTINIRTNPAHVWDYRDLIQYSQVLLLAAIALKNDEIDEQIPMPEMLPIGGFMKSSI